MPRATHQEVIDFLKSEIQKAEPKATANEVQLKGHDVEGMSEFMEVWVYIDNDKEVVSDSLIVGLKKLNLKADTGVTFLGTKLAWNIDNEDLRLLMFSVDMMQNCGGY